MKTVFTVILFGFSTTFMLAQEKNLFKQERKKSPFSQSTNESSLSRRTELPKLSFKNPDDLFYVKFHSEITVFIPPKTSPIVIYPFDPNVQAALRVIYPR